MKTTPTPRTDAESRLVRSAVNGVFVRADLARTLETELAALTAERDLIRACLRDLVDEQNGAPLELRRTQWQAAMDEALAALTKTEDAK